MNNRRLNKDLVVDTIIAAEEHFARDQICRMLNISPPTFYVYRKPKERPPFAKKRKRFLEMVRLMGDKKLLKRWTTRSQVYET